MATVYRSLVFYSCQMLLTGLRFNPLESRSEEGAVAPIKAELQAWFTLQVHRGVSVCEAAAYRKSYAFFAVPVE